MNMHDRIKQLRKSLNLSQAEFGEKLGVSLSVISNLERNILARPEQKLSLIKLMCREFSVNENWLLNGKGDMYSVETFSLDNFLKERNATELEMEIVKTYFELDSNSRKMIMEHFKNRLANKKCKKTPEEIEDERLDKMSIAELEEEYKKTILKAALKKRSTVSSSIVDLPNDNVG